VLRENQGVAQYFDYHTRVVDRVVCTLLRDPPVRGDSLQREVLGGHIKTPRYRDGAQPISYTEIDPGTLRLARKEVPIEARVVCDQYSPGEDLNKLR
jgi:hypothetical protein